MPFAPDRDTWSGPAPEGGTAERESPLGAPPRPRQVTAPPDDPFARYHARVREHYKNLAPAYRRRANPVCDARYHALVAQVVKGRRRVLELGGGSSTLLDDVAPVGSVNCDLSPEMLHYRAGSARTSAVVGAGEELPFRSGTFDGAYSINVLEHVADVEAVVTETARVLERGGVFVAITPNGDWERWLDLAERWRLKIPEGPHRFLDRGRLGAAIAARFTVVEHRPFLIFPSGPSTLSAAVDGLGAAARLPWGFFQYVVARRD